MSEPILTGVMLKAGEPTRNGRIYPREELEKAIAIFEAKGGLGQFYTEEWPRPEPAMINIAQVSHRIKNLALNKDGELIGEVEILKTPMGDVLAEIISAGTARFAPTGYGTVASDGTVTGYTMTSVDVVDSRKD